MSQTPLAVDAAVFHRRYGRGRVTKVDGPSVLVVFDEGAQVAVERWVTRGSLVHILRTIEVVLADGPGAQAREAHDRAHDRGGATPGPDDLETLRVTWYRDCPRCPNMN